MRLRGVREVIDWVRTVRNGVYQKIRAYFFYFFYFLIFIFIGLQKYDDTWISALPRARALHLP